MDRIKLSQNIPIFLERCSRSQSKLGQITQQQELMSIQGIWEALEENSRYADIKNFSVRKVGNEGEVYVCLMRLPPGFSQKILYRYRERGFLERSDVEEAYRTTVTDKLLEDLEAENS